MGMVTYVPLTSNTEAAALQPELPPPYPALYCFDNAADNDNRLSSCMEGYGSLAKAFWRRDNSDLLSLAALIGSLDLSDGDDDDGEGKVPSTIFCALVSCRSLCSASQPYSSNLQSWSRASADDFRRATQGFGKAHHCPSL